MNRVSSKKLVLIALLSALCYIILYIKIPIPAPVGNPFLHLGNMFVLLFALLFGGPVAGIAGSVGMGLFDLLNGYHLYAPKTIILKFLMGISCGFMFGFANKRFKDNVDKIILYLGIFFTTIASVVLAICITTGGVIYIESTGSTIALSPVLYITSYILTIFMFISYFFMKDKNPRYKCALFACTCGIFVNIIGEFLLGALQYMVMTGTSLKISIVLSAVSLPATLLVGIVSIILAVNLHEILIKRK